MNLGLGFSIMVSSVSDSVPFSVSDTIPKKSQSLYHFTHSLYFLLYFFFLKKTKIK